MATIFQKKFLKKSKYQLHVVDISYIYLQLKYNANPANCHFSPLINNADKYDKSDETNHNCWSCINLDGDLVTLTFDLKLMLNKLFNIVNGLQPSVLKIY